MANETILVIDDSDQIREFLIEYVLKPLGYRVSVATDGRAGLEKAIAENPDLIMTDMSMPRMSGLELLSALRESDCQSPVIFMTLHGSEGIAVEAFRLGVRDYLTKPFTIEEAEDAINRALKEVRLEREKEELQRNLIAADTVRQTVVTLSHYINNSLMVLTTGIPMVAQQVYRQLPDDRQIQQIFKSLDESTAKIAAVFRVLYNITEVKSTTYLDDTQMINLEEALKTEMKKYYRERAENQRKSTQ